MRLLPRPPRWWQRATNRVDAALYRRTGKSVASVRADVVLLTTTGRRTGAHRTTPVSVVDVEGGLLIGGGAGGIATDPDWVRNLRAEPSCSITRGREVVAMTARELHGDEREAGLSALYARYAFARRYAEMAGRQVPVFRLEPRSTSG